MRNFVFQWYKVNFSNRNQKLADQKWTICGKNFFSIMDVEVLKEVGYSLILSETLEKALSGKSSLSFILQIDTYGKNNR